MKKNEIKGNEMMRLTGLKTHWTASDAILVIEFLEDLRDGIVESYREDIEQWYQEMAEGCADQSYRKKPMVNERFDDEIPF